jgi:hypothetical protein
MGQAAVVPDPIEHDAAPAGSADDLLSQLAGEEIDRLLAESEAEREAAAPPEPEAPGAPPPAVDTPEVDLGSLQREAAAESIANASAPRPAAAASQTPPPQMTPAAPPRPEPASKVPANRPDPDASMPVYLKPLIWLNAPLASLPVGAREALGKAAIVTLVNALAVLLYVMLFRH